MEDAKEIKWDWHNGQTLSQKGTDGVATAVAIVNIRKDRAKCEFRFSTFFVSDSNWTMNTYHHFLSYEGTSVLGTKPYSLVCCRKFNNDAGTAILFSTIIIRVVWILCTPYPQTDDLSIDSLWCANRFFLFTSAGIITMLRVQIQRWIWLKMQNWIKGMTDDYSKRVGGGASSPQNMLGIISVAHERVLSSTSVDFW